MIVRSTKFLGPLALLAALAACETAPMVAPTDLAPMSGPYAQHSLRLIVKGMNADQALGTEAAMIATLDEYGVPRAPGATLGQWIKDIRAAQNGHGPKLNEGPGGVSPHSLLDAAEDALDNGNYAGPPAIDVHGKIEEECVLPDGTVYSGYEFNGVAPHGSGHLCVTVFTTTRRGNSNQTKTVAQRFLVAVSPASNGTGGFMVEEKTPTGDPNYDPNNVFPDFAAASGLRINEQTASGFDFKLWASGKTIRLIGIWVDKNYKPSMPDFKWVYHKKAYLSLRIPNDDSCIDMMFAASPPTPTMPPTMSPPQYCLGRCQNPPILNTR